MNRTDLVFWRVSEMTLPGYKVAEEAVDLMRVHGLTLKILDDATGEVGFE
jgi:hypothetical protein